MTPTHCIIIYQTLSPTTTPETALYVAGLFVGYDAHARWVISGPTADAARLKMEAFWEKERKSYEPRQGPKKGAPSEGLEAEPSAAVVDYEDEIL